MDARSDRGDAPCCFRWVGTEGRRYVSGGKVRITYRRPAEDALHAVLEKVGKKEEFRFRRQGAAP